MISYIWYRSRSIAKVRVYLVSGYSGRVLEMMNVSYTSGIGLEVWRRSGISG
jgi:hypothetical protein